MHTRLRLTAACIAAALAGTATAGTETHSLNYTYDQDTGGLTPLTFNSFDTMGGTLQLDRVTVNVQADLTLGGYAQSYTPTQIESGEWIGSVDHLIVLSFFEPDTGEGGEDGDRAAPFFFLGGINVGGFTGTLTPGTPGPSPFEPGMPGDPVAFSGSGFVNSTLAVNASFNDYFSSGLPLESIVGPFVEAFALDAPIGSNIEFVIDDLTQTGAITLTYEYTLVPAPASAGCLALAGLAAARRRRA